MIFRGVNLLYCVIELDGLGALVAAGAFFLVFKILLHDVLIGVVLNYFALFVKSAQGHATCIYFSHRL